MPSYRTLSTSEIRDDLDSHLREIREGESFYVCHYNTPIGVFGPVEDLPPQYSDGARVASFTEVRDESSLIRRKLMSGKALVITKAARGNPRNVTEVAAIWPLPEGGAIGVVVGEMDAVVHENRNLRKAVTKLLERLQPVVEKMLVIEALDDQIKKKREVVENLDQTQRRLAGEIRLQQPAPPLQRNN